VAVFLFCDLASLSYLEGAASAWLDVIVCMAAYGHQTPPPPGMSFTFGAGDTDGTENRGHVPSIGGAFSSAARSGEGRVTP